MIREVFHVLEMEVELDLPLIVTGSEEKEVISWDQREERKRRGNEGTYLRRLRVEGRIRAVSFAYS